MDDSYKQEREAFVSGIKGTTAAEVICLSMLTPVWSLTISTCLQAFRNVALTQNYWSYAVLETLLLTYPLISAVTFLSDHVTTLLLLVTGSAIVSLLFQKYFLRAQIPRMQSNDCCTSFISHYRSQLLLDTSISILAVDFPVYPRRLAKTELYGFGYMDVGVGCFVFAAGIVSAEAREIPVISRWKQIKETLKSQILMAVLGLARAISIWAINYHTQVTEYGVHWNFFLTIVAVKLICSCLMSILGVNITTLLSSGFLLLYQWFLTRNRLTEFILDKRREGLFQQNKEGILSLIGYCFLYLLAVQIGRIIFNSKDKRSFLKKLVFIGLISVFAMIASHQIIQPISRRLLNISYVLWMVFFNCILLVLFSLRDAVVADKETLTYLAINRNGVFHFLLANLITGVINLTVDTIHSSSSLALVIIVLYNAGLSLTVLYLHKNQLKMNLLKLKLNKSN